VNHESTGCLFFIGVIAISCGAGVLWGEAVGWIVFGSLCLLVGILNEVLM